MAESKSAATSHPGSSLVKPLLNAPHPPVGHDVYHHRLSDAEALPAKGIVALWMAVPVSAILIVLCVANLATKRVSKIVHLGAVAIGVLRTATR